MRDLYRIAGIQAKPEAAVGIVGSRAGVDALYSLGKVATTWQGGWASEWSTLLKGRHVILFPERDDCAWAYALDTTESLYGHAASLRWVELPVIFGGILEWLGAGGTAESLSKLVKETRLVFTGRTWDEALLTRLKRSKPEQGSTPIWPD